MSEWRITLFFCRWCSPGSIVVNFVLIMWSQLDQVMLRQKVYVTLKDHFNGSDWMLGPYRVSDQYLLITSEFTYTSGDRTREQIVEQRDTRITFLSSLLSYAGRLWVSIWPRNLSRWAKLLTRFCVMLFAEQTRVSLFSCAVAIGSYIVWEKTTVNVSVYMRTQTWCRLSRVF